MTQIHLVNLGSLMRWVSRGVPLPLGSVHNAPRSVGRDNRVDLLVTCLKHPAPSGQTFLVSDAEDVSATVKLSHTAQAMEGIKQ